MTTKNIFYLLFLFCFSSSALAISFNCNNTIFSDTFDYTDNYVNHGWTLFDNGICTDAQLPPKPNISNTFGLSLTGCGAEADYRIDINPTPTTLSGDGLYIVKYDLDIMQLTGAAPEFYMWYGLTGAQLSLNYYSNRSIQVLPVFASGIARCNGGFYDFNVTSEYALVFNMTDLEGFGSYSLYKDGSQAGDCVRKNMSGNDAIDHISLFHKVPAATYVNQYLDNFNVCKGSISNESSCVFPSLFCDDFNYNYLISAHGWIPYGNIGIIDDTTYPINGTLRETTDKVQRPTHTTAPMPISYQLDAETAVTSTVYSPVFSSEMDLNIIDGGFSYSAGINQYALSYAIKALDNGDGTVSWLYYLANGSYANFSTITPLNSTNKLKVNMNFGNRNIYPFNTTNTADYVDVYLDSTYIGRINGLVNNVSTYLAYYEIGKNDDWHFTLDNYYVMAGIDKTADTTELFYEPLYTFTNETTSTGQGTSDFYGAATDVWYSMGLKSAASRYLFGAIIMFIVGIMLFLLALFMGMMMSPVIFIVIELMLMIVLSFVKLMPKWLPIFMGIFGVLGLILYVFKTMRSSETG